MPHVIIGLYSISHPDFFCQLSETNYKEEVVLAKYEIQNLLTRYIICHLLPCEQDIRSIIPQMVKLGIRSKSRVTPPYSHMYFSVH